MLTLIILRHGQSIWNLENRFTGEIDVGLTPLGMDEAKNAGKLIKPFPIDIAYTSILKRAIHTLDIVLTEIGNTELPIFRTKALNERNYGDLQGLNKKETERKYGFDQVLKWRRSYDISPPNGESLKDTYERVIPYYQKEIEPKLKQGKNILIVAHGNSLRSLMMYLENISPEAIVDINLATGKPRLYNFDAELNLIKMDYIN
jgi:2,3-bisphosphoglycerate-dependent phosphoglycerate mutase